MYLTSSHEPRYKRSTRERTSRHEEEGEPSENSSSEEDDSNDTCTEESDATLGSQETDSFQKESERSVGYQFIDHRRNYEALNQSDNLKKTYTRNSRILKQDKVTQKNLLSPFPSLILPPTCREVSGPPSYRVTSRVTSSPKERPVGLKSPGEVPRQTPGKKDGHEEEQHPCCMVPKSRDRARWKTCEKNRGRKDKAHNSRCDRSEHLIACVQAEQGAESSEKIFRPKTEPGNFPRHPAVVATRKPRTAEEEANKFLEKLGGRPRRKIAVGGSNSEERGLAMTVPEKCKRERNVATVGVGGGAVREKLVYVVEEKGKDVTKLETDLFTLNEILAIKKDLLELSEFAKKLKRLKEMKKESEIGRNEQNPCHCKPAAELLKDVNRRIEALEARQEELERGSKRDQKEATEIESKNSNAKQTSSNSQSNVAVMPKPSALTRVLSFPKMEMLVSRGDDVSNNSDIVNELMDIKTQLQRLEKRRMTRENSQDALLGDDVKPPKKDDHAIAVFSSRTYILTETFKRGQEGTRKIEEDEEANNHGSPAEEKFRKEGTKVHVANWLKGISPKNAENDVRLYQPMGESERERNPQMRGDQKLDLTCRNCSQSLKEKDFENQEPQKNRASNSGPDDFAIVDVKKEISSGNHLLKYKECLVTPSGKIFAWVTKSNAKLLADPSVEKTCRSPSRHALSPRVVRRRDSSGSVPSIIMTKEQIRRMKAEKYKNRNLLRKTSQSKSMQELSVNSSSCKSMKTARNVILKKFGKMPPPLPPKDKKHKEDKNHFAKFLEAHLLALTKTLGRGEPSTSSCTYSEFLASINLDTEATSQSFGYGKRGDRQPLLMAFTATTGTDDVDLEGSCDSKEERKRMEKLIKEEKKRRKRKEIEWKKKAKKRKKEQKKRDSAERKRKKKQKICEMKRNKMKCEDLKKSLSSQCCCTKCNDTIKRKSSTEDKRVGERCIRKSSEDCHVNKKDPPECLPSLKFPERCYVQKKLASERYYNRCSDDFQNTKNPLEESFTLETQEEKLPPKNKPTEPYVIRKKLVAGPDCRKTCKDEFQDSTDNSSYVRFKSEDSLQFHRKGIENKRKSLERKDTPILDTCKLKNFVKNLGRLYPKINIASQYAKENCVPKQKYKRQQQQNDVSDDDSWDYCYHNYGLHSEDEVEEDDDDDDDENEDDYDYGANSKCSHEPRPLRNTHCAHGYLNHHHDAKVDHLNNCKCVRVYLQNQLQRGWSGLRPFRKFSTENTTEMTNSRAPISNKSKQSDIFFPGIKPQTFHVGYATECRRRKKDKHRHKHHRRHHKRHRRHKCGKAGDGQCKCKKCGNVHARGHSNDEGNCAEKLCRQEVHNSPNERKNDDFFPLFSFLSHFCKPKPSQSKASKISLKPCPLKIKNSTKEKKNKCRDGCGCKPRLMNIEQRLSELESNKLDDCCSKKKKRRKKKRSDCECLTDCGGKKKHKKKRSDCGCLTDCDGRKKRKKKRSDCGCLTDCEGKKKRKKKRSDCGCLTDCEGKKKRKKKRSDCGCLTDCEGKKKRKKKRSDCGCLTDCGGKKKHKKKRKKKHCDDSCETPKDSVIVKKKKKHKKRKCSCCCRREMEGNCANEIVACYQMIASQDGTQKNSTSKMSTVDRKESSAGSNSRYPSGQGCPMIKERLPSLHSFWKSLRKYKMLVGRQGMENFLKRIRRRKPEISSESELSIVDDCSRGSPIPRSRRVMQVNEGQSFLRTHKKKKQSSKEEKRQGKEAKRQSRRSTEKLKSQTSRKRRKC